MPMLSSDLGPNQSALRRKVILIASIAIAFVVLAALGWAAFDPEPQQRPAKPQALQHMMRPGQQVTDKEAFTQQYANQLKTVTDRLERLERLEAEMKRLREERAGAARGESIAPKPFVPLAPVVPAAPIGLTPEAKRLLATPLPAPAATEISTPALIPPPLSGRTARPTGSTLGLLEPKTPPFAPPERDDPIRILRHESTSRDGDAKSAGPSGSDGLVKASSTRPPAATATAAPEHFVPANTFVRAALLNGLDAPTGGQAQSNPLPVALHLLDTANLPSLRRLDIRDCRILAAAFGDLSSERAILRAETVTCILNDGQVIETPIRGSVVGEDGKVGIRGRLVTKQGQVLGNALLAGIASGIGRAFTLSNTTQSATPFGGLQTVDPGRALEAGAGLGVGRALDQLANYYIRAAEKLFPVIEVDGGRVVELLVTRGATMPAQSGSDRRVMTNRIRHEATEATDD